jgi:hypothetical protein
MQGTIVLAGRTIVVENIEAIRHRQKELADKAKVTDWLLRKNRMLPSNRTNQFGSWQGVDTNRTATQMEPDRQIRNAKILVYTPKVSFEYITSK